MITYGKYITLLYTALAALFIVMSVPVAHAADDTSFTVSPNDPGYKQQWYLDKIGAPEAWAITRQSPNVIVAVIDTGVDIDHPDLINNIWVNEREIPVNGIDDDLNGYIDDINGWDFVNNIFDPNPKFQNDFSDIGLHHGTIVAGIIAAHGSNGFGLTGVTWQAQIMALKVLDDRGEGDTAAVIRAIDYATANGADIINLSFVGVGYFESLAEAITRASRAGVLVVAAAGNEDANGASHSLNVTPAYPVCHDNFQNMVIGVGGTDALDQKAPFSNYGSDCVDIVAPATGFLGLAVYDPRQVRGGKVYNLYEQGYWSGTSMAVPLVSGGLALVKSVNPKLSPAQIKQALFATADNIDALNPEFTGQLGAGRLDLAAAVQSVRADMLRYQGYVVAVPQGNASTTVKVFSGTPVNFKAYTDSFNGGSSIATGDVDGDGNDEIITGAGAGGGPHVRIFNKVGELKGQFFAFAANERNGVHVAAGDVNGDGIDEIIVGSGRGGAPVVKVFSGYSQLLREFSAYIAGFRGGVNVSAGDVNQDGIDEIITGAGKGGGPQVRVFDGAGRVRTQFFAYGENFRGGVNVSAGDVNGDGTDEIITGTGLGGGPQVRVFDGAGRVRTQFFAYGENFRGGVNVSAGDVNQDGTDEIITGAGFGGGPHVRVFDEKGSLYAGFFTYDVTMTGGVNVAVLRLKTQ